MLRNTCSGGRRRDKKSLKGVHRDGSQIGRERRKRAKRKWKTLLGRGGGKKCLWDISGPYLRGKRTEIFVEMLPNLNTDSRTLAEEAFQIPLCGGEGPGKEG